MASLRRRCHRRGRLLLLPCLPVSLSPPLWGTTDAGIKDPSVENPELPFKPAAVPYIAMHAAFTARVFLLANFHPYGPLTCISPQTSPELFLCWQWLTSVLVWAGRIK